jgi:sugar-specific transcriptional regulator TrmB
MDRIEFFKDLGFQEYEAKTLSSLIKLKCANPKEINLDSGVPQNKLYSILKKFEKLEILSMIPCEPKKYQLINIKSFIKEKIKEKQEKLKILIKNSEKVEELKNKDNQSIFSLIKGQRTIMNKLAEANKDVKTEILGVQRNWKVWGGGLRAMQNAIKKGVDVKLIGVVNKENINKVKEWKKIGCKIKAYNKKFGDYPLRFSVFDKKYARITIGTKS